MPITEATALALGAGANALNSGLSALGAGLSNKAAKKIARETNALNYRMFQEGQQYNWDMWNATNEYNSPLNARARLEEAGYNPAALLDAQQLGAAQTMSGPAANAAVGYEYQSPVSAFSQQGGQLINNMVGLSQAQKNLSEAKGQEIDNLYKAETAQANIKALVAAGVLSYQEAANLEQQYDLTTATWNDLMNKAQQESYFTAEKARELKLANDLMEEYGKKIKEQEFNKIVEEVNLLLEQQKTQQAEQVLKKILGNEEQARTIIMRAQQRQEARESNSRINLNALDAAHKRTENSIYNMFGRTEAAARVMSAFNDVRKGIYEGRLLHASAILKELEKDLKTLPANQRAQAVGIWVSNILPILGQPGNTAGAAITIDKLVK